MRVSVGCGPRLSLGAFGFHGKKQALPMRALDSRQTRNRGEETIVRRTIMGFVITVALGCLCAALRAPEAQPPPYVHRIGVLWGLTNRWC